MKIAKITANIYYLNFLQKKNETFSVHPNYTKIVKGEGMPTESGEFGDLRIEFDIVFPERLTPEKKNLIKSALL